MSADSALPDHSPIEHTAREEFLRSLLLGVGSPGDMARRAVLFGAPLDRPVVAFRAHLLAGATRTGIEQRLRRRAAHNWVVTTTVGADLAGVTTGVPTISVRDAVVGVGSRLPLRRAHESFLLASRTLDAALGSERLGTFFLEDVALAAALVADDDVGRALERRYLDGLDAAGKLAGAIASTVLTLLDHDLSVNAVAEATGLHPNSVRYRVRKFEELTGADLTRLEDAFGVWWALRRRQASTSA